MKRFLLLVVLSAFFPAVTLLAGRTETLVEVGEGQVHVAQWQADGLAEDAPVVVLLSGPTDNWNSDSAWFARLGPKLAKTHRVFAIDRAGLVHADPKARVGYGPFAQDLAAVLQHFKIDRCSIIAFASSNITLNRYFATRKADNLVAQVIMIDPDVITPFSIARYKNDAKPMKENLDKYLAYIGEGKYAERAQQKNDVEMAQLKKMAGNDPDTDWAYVESMFAKRLATENLKNLIREIAIYGDDLDRALLDGFPSQIPLTVIDTDFEQRYIDHSDDEEAKKGLAAWREDGRKYYRQLVEASENGDYIPLSTKEHLLPFSDPEMLLRLIVTSEG